MRNLVLHPTEAAGASSRTHHGPVPQPAATGIRWVAVLTVVVLSIDGFAALQQPPMFQALAFWPAAPRGMRGGLFGSAGPCRDMETRHESLS